MSPGRESTGAPASSVLPGGAGWNTPMHRRLAERLGPLLGEKTAKALEKLGVRTLGDLLAHLPRRYFSGTELSDLSTLQPGQEVAVMAEVRESRVIGMAGGGRGRGGGRSRLQAVITDRRGSLTLTFFGSSHLVAYWAKQLAVGSRGIFAGKVSEFNRSLQLTHPDFVILDDSGRIVGGAERNAEMAQISQAALVPIYPAGGKLRTWTIASAVALGLEHLNGCTDPLPVAVREAAGVDELLSALRAVHQPQTLAEVERGRARLRFDEAFGLQLTMAVRRADAAAHGATPRAPVRDGLLAAFDAALPFRLTQGQQEVSAVIMDELARPQPMQRLLQGEVGSGKTIVALRAMLAVVDAGGQAALLAPTEVLAAQHLQTIRGLLGDLGRGGLLGHELSTDVVLVTGSQTAAQRRDALTRTASGTAGIVVGTHALLGTGVEFADLGLVVVDEQHRFGVEQRAALAAKARQRPHVLVMTATPIPRSVAMTVFGDLETSTLRELPAGRADVTTVVVDTQRQPSWVQRAWDRILEEVGAGRQAYVVCPRISSADDGSARSRRSSPWDEERSAFDEPEEGSDDDRPPLTAAEDLYAELAQGPLAGLELGLLHGKLPTEDKEAVMARFSAGEVDVLVATTVVEVGVDVPNASVMVICDADRFGISQLHQLRGRIGRGGHSGVCLLLTAVPPYTPTRDRLTAVAGTRDGFALAEVDLEQRREGDVLGASQSGVRSSLRLLRVLDDADLIGQARDIAEACVRADPTLQDPGLRDIVTAVEDRAAGEWLERS